MIKIAPIFSDRMILQRGKNINVFGTGDDGERVTVSFCGDTAETTVSGGRWKAVLPARQSGSELSMTVTAEGYTRTFTDIAMGEVWLAGGQSNMEYELQNCTTGKAHLENDNPDVRFYYTPKINLYEPDYASVIENTCWKKFDSESAKCWSAVGYIFAKHLSEKLGCPVGVIGCNWGGSKASYWMNEASLEKDEDMRHDLDAYRNACAGKTGEQLAKEFRDYETYHNEWNKRNAEYYSTAESPTWDECLKICGECRYPGPTIPLNPMRACALYESMIKVVCPYTLAGFLYYQGESDDCDPEPYYKLLRGLITLWRDDWGDDELPFLNVQLPMHLYKGDTDKKNWCIIREAQEKVFRTVKNTGMAVGIDCGEFNEIHPHDKEQIAYRLYLQALYNVYGDRNDAYNAPMFGSCIRKGSGIEIRIKTASPLEIRGKKSGFEIAGADKNFIPADFDVNGNIITVSSPEVKEPLHVRYLWTNYTADIPVYNADGLPLAPFRA